MTPNFIPIEYYKTKFYQKENNSKRFLNLTEDDLCVIASKIYKRQERDSERSHRGVESLSRIDNYQRTLDYLTNQYIHLEFKTYDERLAYLIMSVDPNLVTFKEYLKLNLISMSDILKIEDLDKKRQLLDERKQSLIDFETAVREQIGFFDPKLVKHEELFFKRFFNDKELITEVGSNNHDFLMMLSKLLPDFDSISDERYEELIEIAQTWLSLIPEKRNSKIANYSVINQKKLLGLKSVTEQLALFVLLVDSNLDMLRIYEEESKMQNVEERITEEFGYYNAELLSLEKKFHERFCPDKKISVWSKVKES